MVFIKSLGRLAAQSGQSRWWVMAGLIFVLLAGVSCTSTRSGAKPFAAVTLRYTDPLTIRRTVEAVFSEAGYEDASSRSDWVYERGTSKMGQLLYGGWFDEERVRERVKLNLIPLSEGVYRVECQAVMVRDAGEGFFEDEVKMTRLKSRPYEKLLRQVEKRLGPSS